MNQLEAIKEYTTVVADTGDFESMRAYSPRDATTNPSLILKAVQQEAYKPLFSRTVQAHRDEPTGSIIDHVLVAFGIEILKIVPGRVSTEVDARLSFDVAGSVAKAHELIAFYEAHGVSRARVLIKVAATWEGIKAAEFLEREGVHCNLTLVFSLAQAMAAGDAGVTLISPFVGRITDWHKKSSGISDYAPSEDPGVQSVQKIYAAYKSLGYRTEVMGASFRNVGQILELAGCDLLTVSPQLLEELRQTESPVPRKLGPDWAARHVVDPLVLDEGRFRWLLNEDAMATEKLAEGIRTFATDAVKLEALVEATRR